MILYPAIDLKDGQAVRLQAFRLGQSFGRRADGCKGAGGHFRNRRAFHEIQH